MVVVIGSGGWEREGGGDFFRQRLDRVLCQGEVRIRRQNETFFRASDTRLKRHP